jgi:voltage-gated potassium channel
MLSNRTPVNAPASRLATYQRRTSVPVTMATVLIVPALLLEGAASPFWRDLGWAVNWTTWLVLAVHVIVVFSLGGWRVGVHTAGFDAALVLLTIPIAPTTWQTFRVLRLVRVVRLGIAVIVAMHHVRAVFQHRQFHILALVAAVAIGLGAVGIYRVEHDTNPNIQSIGDGLWWAIVTATTVGYGDISPTTFEGRAIAVVLMLLGIGVIGAFTATVASFFVSQEEAPESKEVEERLARLEAKLDALLARDAERRNEAGAGESRS